MPPTTRLTPAIPASRKPRICVVSCCVARNWRRSSSVKSLSRPGSQAVFAPQHALDLDHRGAEVAPARDLHRDRLHLVVARDAKARGAERDVERVVRVAVTEGALAPVDADDLEGHVLHDHGRADEARGRHLEQLRHLAAEHGDAAARGVVGGREHLSVLELVAVDARVFRQRADHLDVDVPRAEPHLLAPALFRHDGRDVARIARERIRVVDRECLLVAGDAAHPAHAGRDGEDVGAERRELRVHRGLRAAAEREHRDDRGDADDHAEHRERGAEQVAPHRVEREADRLPERHQRSRAGAAGGAPVLAGFWVSPGMPLRRLATS